MFRLSKYELRKNVIALLVLLAGLAALEIGYVFGVKSGKEQVALMCMAFLVLYAVVCYFAVFIFAITNYYREINSRTSYLVFMTPVSSLGIILSKMLTVLVLGIILAAVLGALGWLDMTLFLDHYSEYQGMGEIISETMSSIGINTTQLAASALFGIVVFLLSIFSTVAMLYFCITLAATILQSSKLKFIVTVLLFAAGIYAKFRIEGWVEKVCPMVYDDSVNFLQVLIQSWPYALVNLIELAIFMAVTTWLLDKKLSL